MQYSFLFSRNDYIGCHWKYDDHDDSGPCQSGVPPWDPNAALRFGTQEKLGNTEAHFCRHSVLHDYYIHLSFVSYSSRRIQAVCTSINQTPEFQFVKQHGHSENYLEIKYQGTL